MKELLTRSGDDSKAASHIPGKLIPARLKTHKSITQEPSAQLAGSPTIQLPLSAVVLFTVWHPCSCLLLSNAEEGLTKIFQVSVLPECDLFGDFLRLVSAAV